MIKLNLKVEDAPNKIHDQDRLAVKQLIVGLMLKSPEQIQKQVSDQMIHISDRKNEDKLISL